MKSFALSFVFFFFSLLYAVAAAQSAAEWTALGREELERGEAGGSEAQSHFDAAERALTNALTVDPDLPVAVHALASVYMRTGRTGEAATILRRGIEAGPEAASLHAKLGYVFRYAGLFAPSIASYRRSQELDASSSNRIACERQIIKALIYAGRYDEATASYRRILGWLRESGGTPDEKMQFYQGLGYFYAGVIDEAVRMFEASIHTEPDSLWSRFADAYKHAALRDVSGLVRLADELEGGNVSDGERRYRLAHLYAMAGRKQRALDHLEASARSGFFPYPYTEIDRFLETIRDTDEFSRILDLVRRQHRDFLGKETS